MKFVCLNCETYMNFEKVEKPGEGTLGVFTKLRLKLLPTPTSRALVLGVFDQLENAGHGEKALAGGKEAGK